MMIKENKSGTNLTIGVLSDTHGLLRPEALRALEGSDLILHAGDIDRPEVLEQLQSLAPAVAVRGNCDRGPWADLLPWSETVSLGGILIHLLHDRDSLDLDPAVAGIGMVITGHSHIPAVREKDGIWHLNPGSAGPRRFSLPIAMARITVAAGSILPEIITLG